MNGIKTLIGSFFWSCRFQWTALVASFGPVAAVGGAPIAGLIGPTLASGAFLSGGGSLLAGLSVAQLLEGGFTGLSILSNIRGANLQQSQIDLQIQNAELQSRRDFLSGRLEVLRINKDLNDTLASNKVRNAAAGLATGFRGQGSVDAATEAAIKKSEFETSLARENATIQSASKLLDREALALNKREVGNQGLLRAAETGADFFSTSRRRGTVS